MKSLCNFLTITNSFSLLYCDFITVTVVKHPLVTFNPIPPGQFLEPVTPRGGSIQPPSNFKTTKAVYMKLLLKLDSYKKFQFDLVLENVILLFVSYDFIKFKIIETIIS